MDVEKYGKTLRTNIQTMKKTSQKKQFLSVFFLSLYLFFIFGFLLHTSAHPTSFGKYTVKYLLALGVFIISFPLLFFVLKKLSKKFALKKFILFCIIFMLLLFAISETFLRIKYNNYESAHYVNTIENYDPFLQSKLAKTDNLNVNSLGFRGEEITKEKPQDTFRIVVLGGSTVLNREVPFEKNAVRLLEKKLRVHYPEKKIEVINAGKDAYTSEHSLIQYLFKIRDLHPDLIIMWHGVNDMFASCTIEGLSHGNYQSDYSHLFGLTANIIFTYFRPQPVIQIKLVSIDFLRKALQDNLYSDITNNIKAREVTDRAKSYRENKATITVHDFPSIEAYKRNLSYLILLTQQEHIPLLLGNQPNLLKKNPTVEEVEKIMFPTLVCSKNNKYYNLESLHYGITLFNNTTKKLSEENAIPLMDLDSKIPKNLTYFLDSVHYTEKGNELVSQVVYQAIIEGKFLEQ